MNLTAIMVHHDMKLALEYANRVAVIKEGQKILVPYFQRLRDIKIVL